MKKKKWMMAAVLIMLAAAQQAFGSNMTAEGKVQAAKHVPAESINKFANEIKRISAVFRRAADNKELLKGEAIEKIGEVSIIKAEIPYQTVEGEVIKKVLKEAGLESNIMTLKKLQEGPNTIIIFYASQDVTNIKVHTINLEELGLCQWEFETYHKKYGINKGEVLKEKLAPNEVLILNCLEPEGIPLNYLTWDNMPLQDMWLIQYKGAEN